ncbi:sigma-70 family RNA polymerase sigma factor [Georgenia sp. MJ206]|uniref:RNA polymerase sigma factor n=1 Tax=Georgenia wangjunii TaxID=3117730 RepID=UPI002F26AE10
MLEPFEAVVARHGPAVLRVCRAVLGPVHAEDAWSETFLAALRAYPALPPGSNIEAWLVTIAHRKAIDATRAAARRAQARAGLPERAGSDGIPGSWERDLLEAVGALPERQRQAVAYHHLAGLPYADVAELIGGSEQAARKAGSDGIRALRRTYLEEDRP